MPIDRRCEHFICRRKKKKVEFLHSISIPPNTLQVLLEVFYGYGSLGLGHGYGDHNHHPCLCISLKFKEYTNSCIIGGIKIIYIYIYIYIYILTLSHCNLG
jgi:hypothetical protein